MLEARGIGLQDAWEQLEISRATLFNWLKREDPPPSKTHRERLIKVLQEDRDYVLWGRVTGIQESKTPLFPQRDPSRAATLAAELRTELETRIAAAGDHPQRLGWLLEQLRLHLSVPVHWRRNEDTDELRAEIKREVAALANESRAAARPSHHRRQTG